VLGRSAGGGAPPDQHEGMLVLERIDECVEAVETLLAGRTPVASR
jgi:hypothetical protein